MPLDSFPSVSEFPNRILGAQDHFQWLYEIKEKNLSRAGKRWNFHKVNV